VSTYVRALAAFSAILCFLPATAWPATYSQEDRWEIQVGQQRYMDYMQRGEIVSPQSPLYRTLAPIGHAIAAVANRQYFTPFHFLLLNEQTPNAFSMPGGKVYVTTGLLLFLKNRDQLAGVMCHEVSHDIHHDMYAVYQETQGGRSPQDPNAIAYERAAERNADRTGAFLCAKAGFNPWGMVWNFRQHREAMGPSSNGGADHPSDAQREADLIALFQSHRATFGKFNNDVASAIPLGVPRQMAQTQAGYPQQQQQQYYPQQRYQQYPQQYPQQQYSQQQYSQQQYSQQQYSQQQYSQQQYPQQYQRYPQQQYPQQQYPQQYQQYPPQQQYPQYPQQQYPQQYPPPPPCYPGC
jgi:beta-barrel assembly-enhancing protease